MAAIDPTPEYVAQLLSMVHSPSELKRKGFVLQPLSATELLKKARCDRCHKRPSKSKSSMPKPQPRWKGNEDQTVTHTVGFNTNMAGFDSSMTGTAHPYNEFGVPGMNPLVTNNMNHMNNGMIAPGPGLPVVNNPYQANSYFDHPGPRTQPTHHSRAEPPRPQQFQCYYCNRLGHKALDCPDRQDGIFNAGSRPPTHSQQFQCYYCDRLGHRYLNCPNRQDSISNAAGQPPKPLCQWHPGARRGRTYQCCHAHISTPGCHTAPTHSLPPTLTPSLTARFQHHATPAARPPDAVLAVAIDCEMGTSLDSEPELIRVTLLDYFRGAVLLDALVWPDAAMAHFNTRYSGVTGPQMRAAKRDGTCLLGVAAARREVWRFVDRDTVVVGHDVKNDLSALRWTHGVVVDSMLVEEAARKALAPVKAGGKENRDAAASSGAPMAGQSRAGQPPETKGDAKGKNEKETEKPKPPGLSLKAVAKLRLGRDIQKRTHDSFEDALASRDIAHYHIAGSIA